MYSKGAALAARLHKRGILWHIMEAYLFLGVRFQHCVISSCRLSGQVVGMGSDTVSMATPHMIAWASMFCRTGLLLYNVYSVPV